MASIEAVRKALTFLSKTKPASDLDSVDAEAYRIVLEPVDDRTLERAVALVARQAGDFLPSAGTLYQAALDLMDGSPSPSDAWEIALRYACTPRPYKPEFQLPERVRKSLAGMGDPGNWETKDYGYLRVQFEKAYREETERWRAGSQKLLEAKNE